MDRLCHQLDLAVSFGDCDPAGIVFYPNILSWFDRCYHAWLNRLGGHAAVCAQIGARGTGVLEVSAKFRAALRPGQEITLHLQLAEWRARSFRVAYELRSADRLHATGSELRAVFVETPMGLAAGNVGPLRALVEAG